MKTKLLKKIRHRFTWTFYKLHTACLCVIILDKKKQEVFTDAVVSEDVKLVIRNMLFEILPHHRFYRLMNLNEYKKQKRKFKL